MDPFIGGALIGAGGSLLTGLMGGLFSNDQQSTSLAMNRENQRWQSEEWSRRYGIESNHQWAMYNQQMQDWYKMQSRQYYDNLSLQQRMALYNMDLESQEYDRRMNAYQTPEAQARLLQEAGFNPLLAATGINGAQPSPSANTGTGMPSPVAPSFGQSPNPVNPEFQMVTPAQVGNSAMLEAVSGMIEKLSVAMKNGMDVQTSRTLLEEQLRSFILKNNGQELLNVSQQIDNFIAENTKGTQVKKIFQEYQNSVATELLLKNQSDESVSRSLLNFSNKFLADIKGKVSAEQLIQLQILTKNYQDCISAWKKNVDSQTTHNYASAVESRANAVEATEHAKEIKELTNVHKYQKKLLGVQIDREDLKYKLENETVDSEIDRIIGQNKLDKSKVYYELDKLERLINAQESYKTWAEINTILYSLKTDFPSIFNVVVGSAMAK